MPTTRKKRVPPQEVQATHRIDGWYSWAFLFGLAHAPKRRQWKGVVRFKPVKEEKPNRTVFTAKGHSTEALTHVLYDGRTRRVIGRAGCSAHRGTNFRADITLTPLQK